MMSAGLAALCAFLCATTSVLYVLADRPLLAVIWAVSATVWVFNFAMEVTS